MPTADTSGAGNPSLANWSRKRVLRPEQATTRSARCSAPSTRTPTTRPSSRIKPSTAVSSATDTLEHCRSNRLADRALQQRPAHRQGEEAEIGPHPVAACLMPHQSPRRRAGTAPPCTQFVGEAREPAVQQSLTSRQQDVGVASLRNAPARDACSGRRIPLQNGHPLDVVAQDPGGHQTGDTRTDDYRAGTTTSTHLVHPLRPHPSPGDRMVRIITPSRAGRRLTKC